MVGFLEERGAPREVVFCTFDRASTEAYVNLLEGLAKGATGGR